MKKYLFIFAALSACLAVSCNKGISTEETVNNDETPQAIMKTVTITATINDGIDELTKTSYSNTGVFSWTAGDQITVLGDDYNLYTFTANSTGATSTFTGTMPDGVGLGNRAHFPADAGHDVADYKFCIPSSKDISAHPSADIPMVGVKDGTVYNFAHCCGATQLTIDNIPDKFVKLQITISHPSLKLSGTYSIFTSGGYYRWNPDATEVAAEKTFIRKVAVSDNKASIYIPYASEGDWWGTNTLSVIGYDSESNPTTLVSSKDMKSIGAVERAHIKPLTPLHYCNLSSVNWSDAGVFTSDLDMSSSKKCLTELKVTADAYYMFVRVKAPVTGFSGDYLDVFLSDGSGSHYALADDNQYWTTGGETVYREQHKGAVTTSSFSMTFNSKNVETSIENDGETIYYYMALPRSAHSLLSSSGTVYVSSMLWNGWSCTGAIPTRYTAMMAVTLP